MSPRVRTPMFARKGEIERRTRRVLAVHLGLGGGFVGAALVAFLADVVSLYPPSAHERLGAALAALASTTLLSAAVVERALRTPSEAGGRALRLTLGAAPLNVTLFLWTYGAGAVVLEWVRSPPVQPEQVFVRVAVGTVAGLFAAVPGLVVSLPLGAAFGMTYALFVEPVGRALAAPTHSVAPMARRTGGAFLAACAAIMGCVAPAVWSSWSVAPVLSGALLVAAGATTLVAWREHAGLVRLEGVLRGDRHPTLSLLPAELALPSAEAIALAPSTGGTTPRRAIVRRDEMASAYRDRPQTLAYLD